MRRFAIVFCVWFAASPGGAATIAENFASDPTTRGWGVFGAASLFNWNAMDEQLEVTWDSSRTNSYFYRRLGTILAKDDDFELSFDIRLDDAAVGTTPGKPSTFELAIGFLNFTNATAPGFRRGVASACPNLVEFDYFPAEDFIFPTIWPTFTATNSQFNYNGSSDYTLLGLTTGDWFHVAMTYTASNRTLVTVMTQNGAPFGPINSVPLASGFGDFRVDTVAISSYSDADQSPPQFAGSLLAHGVVDNVTITVPASPMSNPVVSLSNQVWRTQFSARTNWSYFLERSTNLQSWTKVSSSLPGTGSLLALSESNAPSQKAFYRVHAERP